MSSESKAMMVFSKTLTKDFLRETMGHCVFNTCVGPVFIKALFVHGAIFLCRIVFKIGRLKVKIYTLMFVYWR